MQQHTAKAAKNRPEQITIRMYIRWISLIVVLWGVVFARSRWTDLFSASNSDLPLDDNEDFLGNSDPLTTTNVDAVLASTDGDCAASAPTNEFSSLSLLSRNDDKTDNSYCGPTRPLQPDTLQLFQDPVGSLGDILSDDDTSKKFYPGLLTPEQQLDKERNPNACEQYLLLGYVYRLCCEDADGFYPEYISVSQCRLELSTSFFLRKGKLFKFRC